MAARAVVEGTGGLLRLSRDSEMAKGARDEAIRARVYRSEVDIPILRPCIE